MTDKAITLGVSFVESSTRDSGLGRDSARILLTGDARALARPSPESRVEGPQRARVGLLGPEMTLTGGPVFAKKTFTCLRSYKFFTFTPAPQVQCWQKTELNR